MLTHKKYHILALIFILILQICSLPKDDKVINPPGIKDAIIYSGYLKTNQQNRFLHYIFVQAEQSPEKAPLVVWLNGGPGCSSLIGFMQQIGPYSAGNTYVKGDDLIKNPYRWNKIANILLIQSPALVGFSSDKNTSTYYTDKSTADDCFTAIKDFLYSKAVQFNNRQLFLTGQSYAGKYVPDLVVRIIANNRQQTNPYINLKGILIGNGVMSFVDNSWLKSRIQYMIDHDLLSERLTDVYKNSCLIDYNSPRCQFFKYQFNIIKQNINRYNIYQLCDNYQNSLQKIRLISLMDKIQQQNHMNKSYYSRNSQKIHIQNFKTIQKCPSDQGMIDYLNLNQQAYHVAHLNKTWAACVHQIYYDTQDGSNQQYKQIFLNKAIKVWFYNGDWDDIISIIDVYKNLKILKRKKISDYNPWFIKNIHAGFYQQYDSLLFITVKGAGHQVPTYKPQAAYQIFSKFIQNKPFNSSI